MSDRDGKFAGDDPFEIAKTWLSEAEKTEPNDPNAVAVASVDAQGMPNVRIVLLKEIEKEAFVFYTNFNSAKAQEIIPSGKAAFVLYWKSLRRQIRVRGHVERVSDIQSDEYFATRSRLSRIGAILSQQSDVLPSKKVLMDKVETYSDDLAVRIIRPENWGGIRIKPVEIEFWADGEARLHDRFKWTRYEDSIDWKIERLYP